VDDAFDPAAECQLGLLAAAVLLATDRGHQREHGLRMNVKLS
jgi:hypothetical protein